MMYGLVLRGTRVMSAGKYAGACPQGLAVAESLPDGDITSYDYIDGAYVYNPAYAAEIEMERKANMETDTRPSLEKRVAELEGAMKKIGALKP